MMNWLIPITMVTLFALLPTRLSWAVACVATLSRWMQFCNAYREETRWRARAEYFESPYGRIAVWWARCLCWSTLVVLILYLSQSSP